MAGTGGAGADIRLAAKLALRFGLPLLGLVVFGRAVVLSVGAISSAGSSVWACS
ncbi:hypothetical protein ACRBEV_11620 [Methylobacterium phyllosphaerae]